MRSRAAAIGAVTGTLAVLLLCAGPALADEILLPGDGQVRARVSVGGNPMVAWPDQRKTYEAMKALERIIERGQRTGEFRPQIDPRLGAVVFYGALDEILTGWVLGQLPDTDDDIAQAESNVVQLLVEGMRNT